MRVLLDGHIPRKLKWRFEPVATHAQRHEVITVPERGWNGLKNGVLLRVAEQEFDVLVTMDGSIRHQQNLVLIALAFIILVAPTNKYADLLPLMPDVNEALKTIQIGDLIVIGA